MKRTSGNVLIVVTALLAVFAIFATGFFFWQKYQSEKAQKELFNSGNYSKNIALPKEKETTKSSTIANWKIYSDTNLGFSLEYPRDATITKFTADNSVRLGLDNSSLLSIRSIPLNGMNLQDAADRNAEVATVAGQILIDPAKITVGLSNGYWVRGQREGVEYTYIDLPGNKNNYLEIAYLQNEPVDQALQKIIDQIISTIKII